MWFIYWLFFLLLYIEWNNINSSNVSFMFDHRFIPHHKFLVTSLFLFQPNVENKNASFDFWLLNDNHERKKKRERKRKEKKSQSTERNEILFGVRWGFFLAAEWNNSGCFGEETVWMIDHVELRRSLLWSLQMPTVTEKVDWLWFCS